MNRSGFKDAWERTGKALSKLLGEWDGIDAELQEHYHHEVLHLLVERSGIVGAGYGVSGDQLWREASKLVWEKLGLDVPWFLAGATQVKLLRDVIISRHRRIKTGAVLHVVGYGSTRNGGQCRWTARDPHDGHTVNLGVNDAVLWCGAMSKRGVLCDKEDGHAGPCWSDEEQG